MREQRLARARETVTADAKPAVAQLCERSSPVGGQINFGAQGGDPSRSVEMDLSTCVNRYGPAPAALAALHAIEADDILLHPYAAADELVDLYRWATGVRGGVMIAGRGASEFIWAMGRELDPANVQVTRPAFTDYLKTFPGRGFSLDGAAVRDFNWSTHSRARMHSDDAWLGQVLSGIPGLDPVLNNNVHFQYAFCRRSHDVSAVFQRHGIGIRILGPSHGVRPDALRIVAPRDDERERFVAAVTELADQRIGV